MVQFAEMIGCEQSTVSRYESGRLIPGRSVLILLLQLAEDAERTPILTALGVSRSGAGGWREQDLVAALKTFEDYLETSARPGTPPGPRTAPHGALAAFAKAAKRIVLEGADIEPALVSVLEHWLHHAHNPKACSYFRHAAAYLEVQLSPLEGRTRRGDPQSTPRLKSRSRTAPSTRIVPGARR